MSRPRGQRFVLFAIIVVVVTGLFLIGFLLFRIPADILVPIMTVGGILVDLIIRQVRKRR